MAVARRTKVDSRATAYALDVTGGRVVTGTLVRKAAEKHLAMLDAWRSGETPDLRWSARDANDACEFFGELRQYKGRWAGQPLQLLDWQAFCVGSIFGWQRRTPEFGWVRLYREAYISVARKNGKTTMCAGLGLWLLDYDGEAAAEVYFAASKRDQARIAFDAAVAIVRQNANLQRRVRHLPSVNKLVVLETASVLLPLGRDSDSEHGLNPSAAVIDELHALRTRDLVDALDTATAARTQPLIVFITTAGVEGVSIFTETDDRARRVLLGVSRDPAMFVYCATLDPDDDWQDPRTYAKANPSLGVTVMAEDLEAELDKAIATPGRQGVFRRLRLNQRTSAETTWLDIGQWDRAAAAELQRRGKRLIGVDLGGRQSLSAAAAVTVDATGIDIDLKFWLPEELLSEAEERDEVPYRAWAEEGWLRLTPGNYRDDQLIADDLSEWAGAAGTLELDLDQWNSTTLVPLLQDRGFTVVVIAQTYGQLSPAVALLESKLQDGKVRHRGNPVMRWNIANTSLSENGQGGRKPIKSDKLRTRRRIDGVSAVLDALARVAEAEEEPPPVVWGFGAV